MDTQTFGSVVAMEFRHRPSISFADIVEEFDIAFQVADARTRALSWDCDDVAYIDRDYVRVALGWLPAREKGQSWHLVVAVGAPDANDSDIGADSFAFLADRIVERSRRFMPVNAVLRGEASQPVGAELIDTVFDLLRMSTSDMHGDGHIPPNEPVPDETARDAYAEMVDTMSPPWMDTKQERGRKSPAGSEPGGNDAGLLKSGFTNHLGQMLLSRAEPTQPLRLTIHTLALSLCLYVPPLGAAMFAYTMLRDIFPMAAQAV